MSIRNMLIATALAFASVTTAHADGLRPIEAKSIDLGEVSGVAYYTAQHDGFHVVTTFSGRQRGERRSVSCLFLRPASAWFSRHRRRVRSKSAGKATACSSARRTRSRTEFRGQPASSLEGMD